MKVNDKDSNELFRRNVVPKTIQLMNYSLIPVLWASQGHPVAPVNSYNQLL